jgi:hypothetical protein
VRLYSVALVDKPVHCVPSLNSPSLNCLCCCVAGLNPLVQAQILCKSRSIKIYMLTKSPHQRIHAQSSPSHPPPPQSRMFVLLEREGGVVGRGGGKGEGREGEGRKGGGMGTFQLVSVARAGLGGDNHLGSMGPPSRMTASRHLATFFMPTICMTKHG